MNRLQRDLSVKLSRQKSRVLELLKIETRSEDEQKELEGLEGPDGIAKTELELRAALQAEPEPEVRTEETDTAEGRELRNLIRQASLGNIFQRVVERRSVDGAEREIQQHFELSDNQVPLAMLRDLETRAVTPAPADVGQNQAAIIPGVFPQSCAAFLGVDMPTVGVGEAVFPVLTTNATVHTPAEGADAAETTGAFSADVLSPSRLQASFFYSREDRARFAGMDAALRENLSDALADGLDKEVLAGTNGLFTGTNLANHNVNTSSAFSDYMSEFGYSRVDGKYAMTTADLKIVMGAATYAHAGAQYRNNSTDRNVLDRLNQVTGGVKVSAHVPAAASNKQNGVIRLGMRRDAVAPVWEGVTLIPDEITKAKSGEIVITAVMLHAVKILRTAGFYKQQTQHA